MTSIKKTLGLLIISILSINFSFAQWKEDANGIYPTSLDKAVGIGTAIPENLLHIRSSNYPRIQLTKAGIGNWHIGGDGSAANSNFAIQLNALTPIFFTDNNFVGIGTDAPTNKLDVRGIIRAGNNRSTKGATMLQGFYDAGALNNVGSVYSSGGTYVSYGTNQDGSNTWLSTSSIPMARSIAVLDEAFRIYTAPTQTVPIGSTLTTQPTEVFTIANNGNVGVGTSIPKAKLHISGSVQIFNQWLSECSNNTLGIGHGSSGSGLYLGALAIGYNYGSLGSLVDCTADAFIAGNVGIGTTTPTEKLSVNGNIKAKKLIVTQTGWADYVFDKAYTLMPVDSLSTYINTHKHLPEMPTTKDVQDHGVDVGNNQTLLLKKIEELTLYIIQQNERIKKLENAQISNVRITNVPMIKKKIN